MNWLKENWFKVGILAAILVVSISVGYYYMIFLPQKEEERTKIESQKQEQLVKETKEQEAKLSACITNTDTNYQTNFESYCISEGRGSNCNSIKRVNADRVEQIEKDEKADCFKKYP